MARHGGHSMLRSGSSHFTLRLREALNDPARCSLESLLAPVCQLNHLRPRKARIADGLAPACELRPNPRPG